MKIINFFFLMCAFLMFLAEVFAGEFLGSIASFLVVLYILKDDYLERKVEDLEERIKRK